MSSRRYVFDTNTLVSALLFNRSKPGRALSAAVARGTLLMSAETAHELGAVLEREKFDRYVLRATRREFLTALLEEAEFVDVSERVEESRDPDDDTFLALAAEGDAAAIVSGDGDLLVLQSFRGIPILTADAFLDQVEHDTI